MINIYDQYIYMNRNKAIIKCCKKIIPTKQISKKMLPSMDDSILIKSINYCIDALRHYLITFFAMLKSW